MSSALSIPAHTKRLIGEAHRRRGVVRDRLTLHADRGAAMTAKATGHLLAGPGHRQEPFPTLPVQRQSLFREPVQDHEVPTGVS